MTKEVYLGSWAFFCDLSGRVRKTIDNPITTTAAVAVPVDLVNPLRTRVRQRFPGDKTKWKYGRLAGLATVTKVLAVHRLPVAVYQVHIADPAKWSRYFEQGEEFIRNAEPDLRDKATFAHPSMTLRMRFLAASFASLAGRLMRARHRAEDTLSSIELEIVADTDFRDEETEEQFTSSVMELDWRSRITAHLGIRPVVRAARCASEQDEPLLLLPDYIAGLYHHADPRTTLGQPVVTPDEASGAVHELRRQLGVGRLLFERSEDFDEEYPLMHADRGRVVLRRRGAGTDAGTSA